MILCLYWRAICMKASVSGAYLVLGLVALGFTLISVFTLSGPGPLSLLRRQVNEVASNQCRMRRERLIRPTYQDGMIAMNMSMTERIKAGKLFTDMCEGLPEKDFVGKR